MKKENDYDCVFKYVIHTTVYELKALDDDELCSVLKNLKSEMREVNRAIHWIKGIIKLKQIERNKNAG